MSTIAADTRKAGRYYPAAPFAQWLADKLRRPGATHKTVAAALGLSERGVRRIVDGRQLQVSERTIDRALTAAGGLHIGHLYPDYWED